MDPDPMTCQNPCDLDLQRFKFASWDVMVRFNALIVCWQSHYTSIYCVIWD